MSVAGVRSNRGDGYQTTIALDWALAMLANERIQWLEVDSTSLGPEGVPISVDDVVVRFHDQATVYCQCKKNQVDYHSWTAADLRDDLMKAGRQLATDPSARILFYSRSPFGELAKLREYAKTQPSAAAYHANLPAGLARAEERLRECWAPTPASAGETYALLQRIEFQTTPELEPMREQQLERLRLHVSRAEDAYYSLWTHLDHLGARIPSVLAMENTHRLTREDLLSLFERHGSSIVPTKSRAELESAFADVSAIGRSWKRNIGSHHVRRSAVDELLEAVRARKRSVLLSDGPGSGKTCVVLDLLDDLSTDPDIATLFIQTREFAHCQSDDERETHGLIRDLVGHVSRMAELKHTVVVIDSLDVLSLARDHAALRFFLRVIDQLSLRPNVTVVTACRSFDLKYDSRLTAREWSCTVTIGPLRWVDEVEPLVRGWGIDPAALDVQTRALLSNPRNLALFADVVMRTGAFNVATAQALTRRYLDVVVRDDSVLGEEAMKGLEAMAQQMLIERRIELARTRVKLGEGALARLLSAEVLHLTDSGNVAFGHQTLLDALAVSRAERDGVSLLEFIRSLPAVPFVRPAVRSFFAYLRSTDRKVFRIQTRAVFESDVAYHLKRLIAESFGEITPDADDWPIVHHLYRKHAALFDSIYYATTSDSWHEFWHAHLVPLMIAEQKAGLLEQHARRAGDWMNSHPSDVIAFWTKALQCEWANQDVIRVVVAHRLGDFVAWETQGVRALLELLVAGPYGEYDGIGDALGRYVEATNTGDDLLWRRIAGHVRDEDLEKYELGRRLRSEPHDFQDPEFLARRMTRSEALLGSAIDAIERWSGLRGARYRGDRPWCTEFLRETSFGKVHSRLEIHHVGALQVLVRAVEAAVVHHATSGTQWWRRNGSKLVGSAEGALRYMAIRACTAAPEANRELVRKIVLDRTMLDSELRFEVGDLIRASYWLLAEPEQDAVARSIVELYDHMKEAGQARPVEWARRERAMLLRAIPAFMRSPEVQRQYADIERELWPLERVPHIEMSGGTVASPFSYERFLEMSDTGVLRILHHYRAGHHEDWENSIGGADHVAWQLREAATRDPERFLRLLAVHWDEVPERFQNAPVAGASTYLEYRYGSLSAGNGEWKPVAEPDSRTLAIALLDELEQHPQRWRHTREAADAIEACAHVVESPTEANRIVSIALDLTTAVEPVPKDSDQSDLVTVGINSTRGNAAEAVAILGTRWAKAKRSYPDGFRTCLLAYASDAHPAVRAVLLRRLPWFQYHDPALGWEAFGRAVAGADEALWSLSEPCLYYAYQGNFAIVADYLRIIDKTGTGKARETWGRISALAWLSGRFAWDELVARLLELADIDAWRGVVTVLAHNAGPAEHRSACFEALAVVFAHAPDPEMVAHQMDPLFHPREAVVPVPASLVRLRFAAFEKSERSGGFHLHGFEQWLVALADPYPDLALESAIAFADFISRKSVPIYDYKPISGLLTRLFREAEEREEADGGSMLQEVIRLQDALLSGGVPGLQEWLRDAERP